MRRSIRRGSATDWGRILGPGVVYLPYLRRQLWKKGLRHPSRLLEGLEVAVQEFSCARVQDGAFPADWRDWRRLLDRAIYQAICELRPCGSAMEDMDRLSAGDDGEDRALEPLQPADCRALNGLTGGDEQRASERGRRRELTDRVEALPVAPRLIAKLKWAALFFPVDADIDVAWKPDEAAFLRQQHPGRTLEDLDADLRERVRSVARRHRGRVPSAVIAWLLGRASADAVDTAFRAIKKQLSEAAPPGAAGVSKRLWTEIGPIFIAVPSLTPQQRSPMPPGDRRTDGRPSPPVPGGVRPPRSPVSARGAA